MNLGFKKPKVATDKKFRFKVISITDKATVAFIKVALDDDTKEDVLQILLQSYNNKTPIEINLEVDK